MKPNELVLDYITTKYQSQLQELDKCNHQSILKIDYTLFNNCFQEHFKKNFFEMGSYKKVLSDVEQQINISKNPKNWISLKIVDVPPNCYLSELDASYSGDMVSAKAMVKNLTEPYPNLKVAVYECRSCMRLIRVNVTDNIVTEPTLCPDCSGKSFRLNQELSEFRNYRYCKLEEPLEYRTGGNTREFKAYMQDYLASPYHNLKAGDVVDIVGEFNVRKTDKSNKKNNFEFIIDLHNITPVDNVFEDYRITEQDRKNIIKLSQEPQIYKRLWNTLAPEIVGYEDVKQGLLLQMFEGYRPDTDIFKHDYMDRWTINILLIGDVGIGKSQLISALKKRTPKIIIINGGDTTKAGLTTTAVKDELTGAWTLEAGAIILADTGVLCIDEFDKLSKATQKALNQPMEQLTVSSTKAGLVRTMSARTSVVACANPKYSRFNPYKPIREQINIPDSTLSRFDLVFALNDKMEKDHDTKLATALLNNNELTEKVELVEDELFKKYVTFAKLEIFPKLDEQAKKLLVDFYVTTRQSAKQDGSAKPITARDLKSLERLTIARAKCELRETATVEDAKCAIELYCKALKTIGLEPESAGELQNVVSDVEMKLITNAENMITAKLEETGFSKITDYQLLEVKHEISVLIYQNELNVKADSIINIALGNLEVEVSK